MNATLVRFFNTVLRAVIGTTPFSKKGIKVLAIGLLALLVGMDITAQTTFQKAFGSGQFHFNNKVDHASSVYQTSDGGYIVAGYSDGTGLGFDDVYLVRFNTSGDTLWTKVFGGNAADRARSVIQTSDGGFVICGETESYGVFQTDALVFKTDSLGNLLWTKTYGGSEEDFASQVIETSDGGLMIVGRTQTYGVGGGYFDAWAIKTNANGVVAWTKTYGGSSDESGNSIQQTTDGGYIICGEISTSNYGVLLIKTDANGDTSWVRRLSDALFTLSIGYSVKQTADGGYIIAGRTYNAIGSYDMLLVKADAAGEVTWAMAYGSASLDEAQSVVEIAGSGYALVGYSYVGVYNALHAIRTNSNGAMQWEKTYSSNYGNNGYEIINTSDGGFAIAGDIWNSFGNTLAGVYQGTDAYLIKTDASGNSIGCQTNAPGIVAVTLSWWSFPSTLTVSAGNTTMSPSMGESASLTNVYDAAILMNFDITSVLCDTACAGAIAVDMCDSAGFYCSGAGPYSFIWSANTGSQTGLTATGLCGGTYQVTVTDASDCSGIGEAIVTSSAIVQELCIVTVDSTSTYNMVVWEKPITNSIDSFRIYRDIVGTYTHIGSKAYSEVSEFVDNTNGVSPAITSYRYKISTVDTCGNESVKSAFHETIHLTVSPGTPPAYNLIWDNYEGIGFLYYRILRDSIGNGFFGVIDSVTSSNFTYTDVDPPSGTMIYAIEVVHPVGCISGKQKNWNSSKSNTSAVSGGALSSSATSNDATPGNCDGNATANATGGTTPYTYVWSTVPLQTSSIATGLCMGTYTVTVTDNTGAIVTSTVLINESTGPVPASEFTSTATSIAPGDSINFIDLSTNSPTSWQWVFTNGTPSVSNDQNPSNIQYNVVGCHDVTLIATNGNGSNTETKTCYIQVVSVGLGEAISDLIYSIAPNPFEDATYFSFTGKGMERIELNIYNLLGEKVYFYAGFTSTGENVIKWSTKQSGVYILRAKIGDSYISEKVIKY